MRAKNGSFSDYYMTLGHLDGQWSFVILMPCGLMWSVADHELPFMILTITMLAAATTEPSHWKYVSEGGATVVFSYIGPTDPHFDGTVLRLRKTSDLADEADDPIIEFQKRCTSRLISPVHLPRLRSVSLEKSWLQRMISLHDGFRPAERRSKDGIDAARRRGVLATDLLGGDWVAVEIKVMCFILTRYHRC